MLHLVICDIHLYWDMLCVAVIGTSHFLPHAQKKKTLLDFLLTWQISHSDVQAYPIFNRKNGLHHWQRPPAPLFRMTAAGAIAWDPDVYLFWVLFSLLQFLGY